MTFVRRGVLTRDLASVSKVGGVRRLSFAVLLIFGSLVSAQARAVEVLSAAELAEHCAYYQTDPEGVDATFCVRYIQGFVDGAFATDRRVTRNVAREYERELTYTERAKRVRGRGERWLQLYGPTYFAEFCLGSPVPLIEVVGKVVDELDARNLVDEPIDARDIVYLTLRKQFPCTGKGDISRRRARGGIDAEFLCLGERGLPARCTRRCMGALVWDVSTAAGDPGVAVVLAVFGARPSHAVPGWAGARRA